MSVGFFHWTRETTEYTYSKLYTHRCMGKNQMILLPLVLLIYLMGRCWDHQRHQGSLGKGVGSARGNRGRRHHSDRQ